MNMSEVKFKRYKNVIAVDGFMYIFDKSSADETKHDTYYEHLMSGNNPPKKVKKFVDTNKRIKKLIDNYDCNNKIIFLKGIAKNIALK
jgi:hypothetical protein